LGPIVINLQDSKIEDDRSDDHDNNDDDSSGEDDDNDYDNVLLAAPLD
jgi:hypothetical protein